MTAKYRARWATRDRVHALRRAGLLRDSILLDSLRGFIVVEQARQKLADGTLLSSKEADIELSPAWCREAESTVREARRRIGLHT